MIDPGTLTGLQDVNLPQLPGVDLGPVLLGSGAAFVVSLVATPLTGALVASYAPRSPVKGAVIAVALGAAASVLVAGLVGAGAAASARNLGTAAGSAAGAAAGSAAGRAAAGMMR